MIRERRPRLRRLQRRRCSVDDPFAKVSDSPREKRKHARDDAPDVSERVFACADETVVKRGELEAGDGPVMRIPCGYQCSGAELFAMSVESSGRSDRMTRLPDHDAAVRGADR